jgi:hypothetical protein
MITVDRNESSNFKSSLYRDYFNFVRGGQGLLYFTPPAHRPEDDIPVSLGKTEQQRQDLMDFSQPVIFGVP